VPPRSNGGLYRGEHDENFDALQVSDVKIFLAMPAIFSASRFHCARELHRLYPHWSTTGEGIIFALGGGSNGVSVIGTHTSFAFAND
jgi:hypothetical protein